MSEGVLDMDAYRGGRIPLADWEFTELIGDIILAEYMDHLEGEGQAVVNRGGILVPTGLVQHCCRGAKVLMGGPDVPKNIKPGKILMVPYDRGIPAISAKDNKALIFINAPRIFGIVEPRKQPKAKKLMSPRLQAVKYLHDRK
jgi:hypothetical protein